MFSSVPLFVVRDNGFEEIAEAFVAARVVLACDLKQQAFESIEAAERIDAPIGGACVFGEIARNVRDTDAFFNTTAVVVAFAA